MFVFKWPLNDFICSFTKYTIFTCCQNSLPCAISATPKAAILFSSYFPLHNILKEFLHLKSFSHLALIHKTFTFHLFFSLECLPQSLKSSFLIDSQPCKVLFQSSCLLPCLPCRLLYCLLLFEKPSVISMALFSPPPSPTLKSSVAQWFKRANTSTKQPSNPSSSI